MNLRWIDSLFRFELSCFIFIIIKINKQDFKLIIQPFRCRDFKTEMNQAWFFKISYFFLFLYRHPWSFKLKYMSVWNSYDYNENKKWNLKTDIRFALKAFQNLLLVKFWLENSSIQNRIHEFFPKALKLNLFFGSGVLCRSLLSNRSFQKTAVWTVNDFFRVGTLFDI